MSRYRHDQEFLFFYLVNDAKGENLRHILTGRDNEIRTRVAAWDLFFSHQKAQNGVSLRYNAVKWFAGSANFSKNKRNISSHKRLRRLRFWDLLKIPGPKLGPVVMV